MKKFKAKYIKQDQDFHCEQYEILNIKTNKSIGKGSKNLITKYVQILNFG